MLKAIVGNSFVTGGIAFILKATHWDHKIFGFSSPQLIHAVALGAFAELGKIVLVKIWKNLVNLYDIPKGTKSIAEGISFFGSAELLGRTIPRQFVYISLIPTAIRYAASN